MIGDIQCLRLGDADIGRAAFEHVVIAFTTHGYVGQLFLLLIRAFGGQTGEDVLHDALRSDVQLADVLQAEGIEEIAALFDIEVGEAVAKYF